MAGTRWKMCGESSSVENLRLSTHAYRYYKRLLRADQRLFDRVESSLGRLLDPPEVGKPLVGPLEGHRSLRVGHLRIIYRIDSERSEILALDISPRGGAYR